MNSPRQHSRILPLHNSAIILTLGLALGASRAAAQSVENAHVSSAGAQANWTTSYGSSISEDNRWIAFDSQASNLVAGDTNNDVDCFVHDRTTGATILISRAAGGGPSDGLSVRPSLSATGRYVAFTSVATNLVAGGVTPTAHIFRYDRDTDGDGVFDEPGATTTILVSVSSSGEQGNGGSRSYAFALSDNGDRISFESDAANLVANDTNNGQDCFVRTVSTGTTIRVSVNTAGEQTNGGSCAGPAISGNGNIVAFYTSSPVPSNLVPGDTNGASDIFYRDIALGTTARASVSSAGAQATGPSTGPCVSDDGNLIAFTSGAPDLVVGDGNVTDDAFVRNVSAGTTTRLSVSTVGGDPDNASGAGAMSGNGGYVAIVSMATNLVTGDTNATLDVFVRDLSAGTTAMASRAADGTVANSFSTAPYVSDDGTLVSFGSEATNLLGAGADTNGWADIFVRVGPFIGPGPNPGPGAGSGGDTCACACGQNYDSTDVDVNPVTFSVNGPVDPNTDGIRYARGGPFIPQAPIQPGNPIGACIRTGPVPQAAGLFSPLTPGDVFDYAAAGVPDDAVMFQSAPLPLPVGGPPNGTNNQILEAAAMGLVSGPGVIPPFWVSPGYPRDNIDAFSFGEDYFPDEIITGLADSAALPLPPLDADGEPGVMATPWLGRVSLYDEPVVVSDAPGTSFRFSVDPWATGLPATAVLIESGGFDVGAACGPWTSPGDAAGDVFGTPTLMRIGGVAVAGGTNSLVHDNPLLALAPPPPPMMLMEDDLDALECVGENSTTWMAPGVTNRPGNLYERIMQIAGVGLPPPGLAFNEPVNIRPEFFSVTRSSPGAPFTAVRSQFVIDGGAAGDVFVAAKNPMAPAGVGTNLLFIDESEIGLYAADASPGGTGAMDWTDDLDALLLCVCEEYRPTVVLAINEILGIAPPFMLGGFSPWVPYGAGSAYTGGGMTISITKYLEGTGRPVPDDCIHIAFSVNTDAIGLEYTAVDYEAGPVFPPGGVSAAAGDIFYADVDGEAVNPNYLWYEETNLGLAAGVWVNGAGMGLAALTDNLNALDAIYEPPDTALTDTTVVDSVTSVGEAGGLAPRFQLEGNSPNPFNPRTTIAYSLRAEGHARLAIHDAQGRVVRTLVDEVQRSGRHQVDWDGKTDGGDAAASGIYFMRLSAGGESLTRKITMLK